MEHEPQQRRPEGPVLLDDGAHLGEHQVLHPRARLVVEPDGEPGDREPRQRAHRGVREARPAARRDGHHHRQQLELQCHRRSNRAAAGVA